MQEAAAPRVPVAMIWQIEEKRYGDGGLLYGQVYGVVLARSHPSSTLYFGIVILCTLICKAWFTYMHHRTTPTAFEVTTDTEC